MVYVMVSPDSRHVGHENENKRYGAADINSYLLTQTIPRTAEKDFLFSSRGGSQNTNYHEQPNAGWSKE